MQCTAYHRKRYMTKENILTSNIVWIIINQSAFQILEITVRSVQQATYHHVSFVNWFLRIIVIISFLFFASILGFSTFLTLKAKIYFRLVKKRPYRINLPHDKSNEENVHRLMQLMENISFSKVDIRPHSRSIKLFRFAYFQMIVFIIFCRLYRTSKCNEHNTHILITWAVTVNIRPYLSPRFEHSILLNSHIWADIFQHLLHTSSIIRKIRFSFSFSVR